MSLIKDIYIRELETEWSKLEDAGVPTDLAYQLAGKRAYDNVREAMARRADMERLLRKEH
jgi:hypothetical protein